MEIDGALFAAFMPHSYPAQFGRDVQVRGFQMGHIAHATASPIPQGEDRCTARGALPLDQAAQDKSLIA